MTSGIIWQKENKSASLNKEKKKKVLHDITYFIFTLSDLRYF